MTALSDVPGTDASQPTPDSPGLFAARLSGDVDMTRRDELNEIAKGFQASGAPIAHVDLREVTFMESTGLGLLSRLRNVALTRGGRVILVEPASSCMKMLKLVGFGAVFDIRRELA